MIGNIILVAIAVMIGFILYALEKILGMLVEIDITISELIGKNDYKTKESIAESLLEEEGNAIDEDSLYYDKNTGTYSYKVYAENKRKQDNKGEPEAFIDDYEKSAVEAERKN
jgi:hypothetical protein